MVTAQAFAYDPITRPLTLADGEERTLDFTLAPQPDAGWLNGRVTEAKTGIGLNGRVLVEGTPVAAAVIDGSYAVAGLPPGTYVVRAESAGHKVGYGTAVVLPRQAARLGLHPLHGRDHQHDAVEHAQRPLDLGDEVGMAGGIDEIDGQVIEPKRDAQSTVGRFQRQRLKIGLRPIRRELAEKSGEYQQYL